MGEKSIFISILTVTILLLSSRPLLIIMTLMARLQLTAALVEPMIVEPTYVSTRPSGDELSADVSHRLRMYAPKKETMISSTAVMFVERQKPSEI